jgi:aryl-alcohol dehydrogenase-like predicted oxidoreductase
MKYRQLGKSDLSISTVSLGSWLTYGSSVDSSEARKCVLRAYELGVTFFDTANVYAHGHAEEVLGEVLKELPRDSFIVGTKVYWPVGPGEDDRGLGRKHVSQQIDLSLKRLQLDHVELYQCHRYDDETPLEETCQVMNDLIKAGKVRYWGVSEWTAEQIKQCVEICQKNGWVAPVSNQPQYSALYRRIEADVIPTCEELGITQVVWSPLAQGVLTGKYRSVEDVPPDSRVTRRADTMSDFMRPDVLDAVSELQPIALSVGCTMAQLALAWCLRLPNITSVITGASRESQVEENVLASDLLLNHETIERIDAVLASVAYGAVAE